MHMHWISTMKLLLLKRVTVVVILYWQLALFVVYNVLKGYLHIGGEEAQRSKASICTWSALSHCGAKTI